jgi:hypothetical protein
MNIHFAGTMVFPINRKLNEEETQKLGKWLTYSSGKVRVNTCVKPGEGSATLFYYEGLTPAGDTFAKKKAIEIGVDQESIKTHKIDFLSLDLESPIDNKLFDTWVDTCGVYWGRRNNVDKLLKAIDEKTADTDTKSP